MKRMKLAALTALLCLVVGTTAQAEGSAPSAVQVSQGSAAVTVVKADGTVVEDAQPVPVMAAGTGEAVAAETAESALGVESGTVYASYEFDVSLTLDGEQVDLQEGESISLTFSVPGVTASSKVAVFHWADGSAEPEKLAASAGEGTVTATFTSFSPVQIVVANEPAQPQEPDTDSNSGSSSSSSSSSSSGSSAPAAPAPAAVSPKTAEGVDLYVAAAVAAAALAGFVICTKKSRA